MNDSNIRFFAESRREFLKSLDRNGDDEQTKLHFSSWQHSLRPQDFAWLHSAVDREMQDAMNTEPGQKTVTLDEAGQAIIDRQKTPDGKELARMLVGDVKRYHREAEKINATDDGKIYRDSLNRYEEARLIPYGLDRGGNRTRNVIIQEDRNSEADARADLAGDLEHDLIKGGLPLNANSKTVAAAVQRQSASHIGTPFSGRTREVSDLEGHVVRVWDAHQQQTE